MINNKSKHHIFLKHWISMNCPSVQRVLVILICKDISLFNLIDFILRIKSLRHHGLLGPRLIINHLTVFFSWTTLDITLDI